MASSLKNLSEFNPQEIPDGKAYTIGIVVAEWNSKVTDALLQGALVTLRQAGVLEENILVHAVPGTFELALGAQVLAEKKHVHAVITLGCVIQGETRHFDFICDAAANGIMEVSLKHHKPVAFGVLTTDNQLQALERAGGIHGNKGVEAAVTVLKMLLLMEA